MSVALMCDAGPRGAGRSDAGGSPYEKPAPFARTALALFAVRGGATWCDALQSGAGRSGGYLPLQRPLSRVNLREQGRQFHQVLVLALPRLQLAQSLGEHLSAQIVLRQGVLNSGVVAILVQRDVHVGAHRALWRRLRFLSHDHDGAYQMPRMVLALNASRLSVIPDELRMKHRAGIARLVHHVLRDKAPVVAVANAVQFQRGNHRVDLEAGPLRSFFPQL